MVLFGIFWLVCLAIVLVEVLRAPIHPPFAEDGDPDGPQDHRADPDGGRRDHPDPDP